MFNSNKNKFYDFKYSVIIGLAIKELYTEDENENLIDVSFKWIKYGYLFIVAVCDVWTHPFGICIAGQLFKVVEAFMSVLQKA